MRYGGGVLDAAGVSRILRAAGVRTLPSGSTLREGVRVQRSPIRGHVRVVVTADLARHRALIVESITAALDAAGLTVQTDPDEPSMMWASGGALIRQSDRKPD